MPVEFLDDVAPPAAKADGGFEFLDAAPGQGVEVLDDKPIAPEAADVAARMEDPAYMPTQPEFEAWRKHEKEKPWFQPNEWTTTAVNAGVGLKDMVVKGVRAMFTDSSKPVDPNESGLQTIVEAGARGTMNDAGMVKKVLGNVSTGFHFMGSGLNEDQYIAIKLGKVNEQAFPKIDANTTLLTRADVPAKTLAEWKKEFAEQYKPKEEYQSFIDQRTEQLDALKLRELQAKGQGNVAPEIFGKPNNDLAEGLSLVESPVSLMTLGGGAEARVAATGLERAAAMGAKGTGRALSLVGRGAEAVAALPAKLVNRGVEWLADSPEAGNAAAHATEAGAVGGAAGVPHVAIPGVSLVAEGANVLRAAAKPVTAAGEALQAAGRAIETGPSRTGLLGTIATDGAAPKWIRNAAAAGKWADPVIGVAGSAAQGAVHGAAIGGALGALSEGNEEGVFGGIGSGAALGAGFGTVGRLASGKNQLEAKRQADLNRWFLSKTPDEQANIHAMGLSFDDAVKYATLEQVARGIRGAQGEGDVRFVYADDGTFQRAFGGSAKGAEFVQGDTPTVVINVDKADAGTLPHEVFHGLFDLAVGDEAKAELNRKLFTQEAPDGTVLTQGVFSPADLKLAEDQYVSRLHQAGKDEWALLSPEQRMTKIRGELAADAFANLVKSHHADYLLNGFSGVKRRLADSLLQAQDGTVLGQLRDGLKRAGVKFDASGAPSELFVRDGKPITNSPQVDAALRDYLRAKEKIRARLVADEDAPSATVVSRQDMGSKNAKVIAELYKSNDNFAKDAAGNLIIRAGLPVLLTEGAIKRLQAERTEAMIKALERVPDKGGSRPPGTPPPGSPPGALPAPGRSLQPMRLKDNGAWEGHYFTDEQLAEINRIPHNIMAPSLKEKLAQMNAFHQQADGTRFVLDYNAATKEARGGGRIYSSGIKSTLRDVVPISMHISKAGNFYSTGLDTTVLFSKFNRWFKEKPRAFDSWGGDRDAVIRDMFKYLDNHASGREGSVGLDAGAATAVHKKNVLNDLFGVARGTGANPLELSTKGGKDQLVRSFRFDRTNRITESGGDKMPFDYQKQKVNFMPEDKSMSAANREAFGKSVVVDEKGEPLLVFHGGDGSADGFERGSSRGLGFAYFTDAPEVASKYALGGGIKSDLSVDDYIDQLKSAQADGRLLKRHASVTPVFLRIENPVTEKTTVVGAFRGDRIKAEKALSEWSPRFLESLEDEERLEGPISDDRFWDMAQSAIESSDWAMEDTEAMPRGMHGIATLIALNRDKFPHFDGIIYPDQEAGGTTYVVFEPGQIIPKFQKKNLNSGGVNFLPASQGGKWEATTPIGGVPAKGRYEVHEAKDLVTSFDKAFDPTLQPRDRSRAASVNQIATIVQKFEPQRLGEAPTTDMGAPIIDDQRQVLSGNGRTASLRTLYGATDPAKGETYKQYLVRNAGQFGLKPAEIEAMQAPVLVRKVEDYGGLSKAEFARQSNQSQLLSMSGAEKASADARMLTETPGLLDKFAPSEEGNVLADTNREFLNHFIQATGDGAELLTEKGYNQDALRKRVETAVMATLIGPEHRDLITKLLERSDKFKIRKAVNGLMQSSAKLVKLQGTDYAVGGYLQEALANLIRLRGSGEKVEQFLASKTLIGNSDRTAAGDHVLEFLAKARSMKQVNEDLQRYYVMANNAIQDAQSGGLFGDAPRTREQLIAEIYGKLQRDNAQYPQGNQASQPAGQPAPVASPASAQTPGPSLALQPASPSAVAPVAPVTPTPAPAAVTVPAVIARPRPPGAPAFMTRPLPRGVQPMPGPGGYRSQDDRALRVSPQAVIRHTQAQAVSDIADKLAAGVRLTPRVRTELADYYFKRLDSSTRGPVPALRSDQISAAASLAHRISPADIQAIATALTRSGLAGARRTIDQQANLKSALARFIPPTRPTASKA